MKKTATYVLASAAFLCSAFAVNAQENGGISPYSFTHQIEGTVPTIVMPAHDFTQDIKDAEVFEKNGNYPRFARHFDVNQTMLNSGVWTEVGNGDRVWRLDLKSAGALSTDLFFDQFFIPEGATLHVYTPDHKQVSGSYTYLDNQGNNLFSTEFLSGDEQTIEYFEPASVRGQGSLRITQMSHQYRILAMADPCEVNIICSPEGDNWQDEKRGVCRVYVVEGSSAGYCSGTLINNTARDCKRYILTAFHCGVDATTANFTLWKFYFNYEATTCGGGDGGTGNTFTGCVKRADSDDNGGDTGSDFLFLEMTTTTSPSWWSNVYWNGWSNANVAPPAGSIGIHHPAGTNKKISQTTGTGSSTSWGGSVANTHWQIHWGGTTNGWGVTEGGSSGSPLFNTSSQVIGTLTGGGSYCNTTVAGGQTQPDAYGKLAYHWTSDGTVAAHQLKPWLDPGNTGAVSMNGSYSPCTTSGTGINSYDNDNAFSVYPNPNNGAFNVSIKLDKQADVKIRVMNLVGQEMMSKLIPNAIEGIFNIDMGTQPNGIYFVEIKTGDKTIVKKINVVK